MSEDANQEIISAPANGAGNGYQNVSIEILDAYDANRHILVDDSFNLLQTSGLDVDSLKNAIDQKNIHMYTFGGQTYVDRLDIGRVYHKIPEQKSGLKIERFFSDGKDPFETVDWGQRNLELTDYDTGEVIFSMENAEFPVDWAENEANIVAQKYFYKPTKQEWKDKLESKIGRNYEFSPQHLIERVTNFVADEGHRLGYFATEKDKDLFVDELKWLQINRRLAFNSPVQFNGGINNEYGIEGSPDIKFYRDPETGEASPVTQGCNVRPQSHACFIKGPRDNLGSILKHLQDEGAIFSSGSGVGQGIGALRGQGEELSSGGQSSGSMSFLEIFDRNAGYIKSGGKSRRAARMATMRQNHPDILDFIRRKVGEDRKALALMEAGYSDGMDGEAYTTVSLQNTNLSARVDGYFFEQFENGGNIELRRVTDNVVVDQVSAERMLQEISFGSWRIGDPAVQYDSEIQRMHTCKNSGRINSTNPCSEYVFIDDTSCNLASLNLLEFLDEDGNFNTTNFRKAARLVTIAQDILNDASGYPVESIAKISPEFRTIGLGYANLGALITEYGYAYDSLEGRALAGGITALLSGAAYETSSEIAENLGTFVHFEFNKGSMLEVMENHQQALDNVDWNYVSDDLKDAAFTSWDNVIQNGEKFGFRNAQTTVLAPTGTISYLMGCDTTGIEPALSFQIKKNLAGGGNLTLENKGFARALKKLGYSESETTEILDYAGEEIGKEIVRGTVHGAPHLNPDHYSVFDTAFGNSRGEGTIAFEGHVRMVAATQPFISGAISKTNNLPENATVKDIFDGYVLGHELGVKALSVFRNNSKPISALDFGNRSHKVFKRGEKEEIPSKRGGLQLEVEIDGIPFHVFVGDYADGRPGQVVFLSYQAGSTGKALLETQGIIASKSLKRGVDLEDITSAWIGQHFEPHGLVYGHPFIKMALSPLDFAGKLLNLEYKGMLEYADNQDGLDETKLWGFTNGAFETYKWAKVDDWNVDVVLGTPELGGFSNGGNKSLKFSGKSDSLKENGVKKMGRMCRCGRLMQQTAPGCHKCVYCGDTFGGCGA